MKSEIKNLEKRVSKLAPSPAADPNIVRWMRVIALMPEPQQIELAHVIKDLEVLQTKGSPLTDSETRELQALEHRGQELVNQAARSSQL